MSIGIKTIYCNRALSHNFKVPSFQFDFIIFLVRTGHCKDNTWTHLNGSDYEYYFHRPSSHDMTWYGARAVCMQMGADLVKINNQAEIDFLKGLPVSVLILTFQL